MKNLNRFGRRRRGLEPFSLVDKHKFRTYSMIHGYKHLGVYIGLLVQYCDLKILLYCLYFTFELLLVID